MAHFLYNRDCPTVTRLCNNKAPGLGVSHPRAVYRTKGSGTGTDCTVNARKI